MVNEDYRDVLNAFNRNGVRFLIVGAHALAAHGLPRATVDLDIWVEPTAENAHRVWQALAEFGAPLEDLDIREADFTVAEIVAQFGLPPHRIDVLTGVSGLTFEEAWRNRVPAVLETETVFVLSREDLIRNKLATGRPRDRIDVDSLDESD